MTQSEIDARFREIAAEWESIRDTDAGRNYCPVYPVARMAVTRFILEHFDFLPEIYAWNYGGAKVYVRGDNGEVTFMFTKDGVFADNRMTKFGKPGWCAGKSPERTLQEGIRKWCEWTQEVAARNESNNGA